MKYSNEVCKDDESFYVDANQEVHQDPSGNQCFKEYASYSFTEDSPLKYYLTLQFPDENSMDMEDNGLGINYMPINQFRFYKKNRDGFYERSSSEIPLVSPDTETNYLFDFPRVSSPGVATSLYKIEMYNDQCEANGEHYYFIEYYYLNDEIMIQTDLTEYNAHPMNYAQYNLENYGADSLALDTVVCKKCLEIAE